MRGWSAACNGRAAVEGGGGGKSLSWPSCVSRLKVDYPKGAVLNDLQWYLIHEFVEEYKAGLMSRRDMMRRVLYITGGVASTATILTTLGCGGQTAQTSTAAPATKIAEKPPGAAAPASPVPNTTAGPSPSPAGTTAAATAVAPAKPSPPASPAAAASPSPAARSPLSVAENDPAIETAEITFPNEGATIRAYQAKPRGNGPFPVVLVCHENRGLTDHIRDVSRRWAKEGYVACAVDLLSREGGTRAVADAAQIPGMLSNTPPERHVGDFGAALKYYDGQAFAKKGFYGMNGFCFGGGITWRAATKLQDLKAAAPYYGPPPPSQDVSGIKAAIFGVYSSDPNDFANRGRDELAQALKSANVTYEFKVYPDTFHAFNNDTGERYNEQQSIAAWRDVTGWFGKYLKG